jgi:DNA-directed RNA polymerase specialized sigma24 family protein
MGQDIDPYTIFLSLLSPDRDIAENKFRDIRRRLARMLDFRGCACSYELADDAILDFVCHLQNRDRPFEGDPIAYLSTVAYNLYLAYLQRLLLPLPDDISERPQEGADDSADKERLHQYLDLCLEELSPENHDLILRYYRWEKQAKIDFRKKLAAELGISANALKIRVYHIRKALGACIEERLGLRPPPETE